MTIRRLIFVLVAAAASATLAGCAAAPETSTSRSASSSAEPREAPDPSSSASPAGVPEMPSVALAEITLTVEGDQITGRLEENAAARELLDRPPLTLTFEDFNAVEKIARLETPLSLTDMPESAEPSIGDIGFWAPSGDLVLYYGDVGYFAGIARLGTFDDPAAVQQLTSPTSITISRR